RRELLPDPAQVSLWIGILICMSNLPFLFLRIFLPNKISCKGNKPTVHSFWLFLEPDLFRPPSKFCIRHSGPGVVQFRSDANLAPHFVKGKRRQISIALL